MKPKIVSLKNLVVWKVRTTHLKNTLESKTFKLDSIWVYGDSLVTGGRGQTG